MQRNMMWIDNGMRGLSNLARKPVGRCKKLQ
jgi:hypothetical protein